MYNHTQFHVWPRLCLKEVSYRNLNASNWSEWLWIPPVSLIFKQCGQIGSRILRGHSLSYISRSIHESHKQADLLSLGIISSASKPKPTITHIPYNNRLCLSYIHKYASLEMCLISQKGGSTVSGKLSFIKEYCDVSSSNFVSTIFFVFPFPFVW